MMSSFSTALGLHPEPAGARICRAALPMCVLLAGAVLQVAALAQQEPAATANVSAKELKQIEETAGRDNPLGAGLARAGRMTDPNAGKRPGDEKLGCDQIKAEFEDTSRKYGAQRAKRDAARDAIETDARKTGAEVSGPGAIGSGFLGGLAALGGQLVGAGDAVNEKAKADLMATQNRRQEQQNQFAQDAEATKALSDRGRTLMALGQAKGCSGLAYKP